jgi:hypothetical protein
MYEPILFCVKDKNNYTFNTNDILVEAKTGAKRKLIDYRKAFRQFTIQRKFLVMFGSLQGFVIVWMNTKIIQHRNQLLYLKELSKQVQTKVI